MLRRQRAAADPRRSRPPAASPSPRRSRPGRGRGQTGGRERFIIAAPRSPIGSRSRRVSSGSSRRPGPDTAPGAASACRLPSSICIRHVLHSVEPNSTRGRASSSSIGRPAASDDGVVLRLRCRTCRPCPNNSRRSYAPADRGSMRAGPARRRAAQRLQVARHMMADGEGRAVESRCAAGPGWCRSHR